MGRKLSIAAAAVPWALTLLGIPVPAVDGGLSTTAAVVSALPKRRTNLSSFVERAMKDFEAQCAGEARGLSDADQEAVQARLKELLATPADRYRLLGAALLGKGEFQAALVASETVYDGLGDDGRGYLNALVIQLHGLVLRFAQSEEVLAPAATAALRRLQHRIDSLESQLAGRPTLSQVGELVREWSGRALIVGSRPALASDYVPRDEMSAVRDALATGGIATVCALQGMRGVGKSQLASAFAQECENAAWAFVGWVTASSRQQVTAELAAMARLAGLSDSDDPGVAAAALVMWLNGGGPDDRLLVFDNVASVGDLQDLLPRGPGMRVIITTNSRAQGLGTPVEVGSFTPEQASEYLNSATHRADSHAAGELAEELGRLPVALAQAAFTINLLRIDYDSYRELLAERSLDDAVRRAPGDPYPLKVGVALRTAYGALLDGLEADNPAVKKAAALALGALSFLSESGVPREWLNSLAEDPLVMQEAVGELLQSSLLTVSDDGEVVAIHRLQAQVIREDIAAGGGTVGAAKTALAVLAAADVENPDHWSARHQCDVLTRQLVAIRNQPQSRVLVELPDLLYLVRATMFYANGLGNPFLALQLAGYGEIFTQVLDPDDREAAVFRNNLGRAHELAGHLDLAIPLYEQTLRDRERILGPTDSQTVTSRNNLGLAYLAAGEVKQAVPLLEQALREREQLLEPDDPLIAQSRINVAAAYSSDRKHDRAISLSKLNVTHCERAFGANDLETVRAGKALADAYIRAGDLAQGVPLLERALGGYERAVGRDHPETLVARNNLAGAYRSNGNLDLAISLLEQTLSDSELVLDPDHPNILAVLGNLAEAHAEAGHHVRAASLYRRLATDSARILGSDHTTTLEARHKLATIYFEVGNLPRAIPLLEQSLADLERLYGPDAALTRGAREDLETALVFRAAEEEIALGLEPS